MIVFLTAPWHGGTVKPLIEGTYGVDVPPCMQMTYLALFRQATCPVATYVFTDLERLAPWELTAASALFRFLRDKGLRCLNDPAIVPARVELLRLLAHRGLSDIGIWRADERPRPDRFPVFVRGEQDHGFPTSDLIDDQAGLDRELERIRATGRPLRGLIVLAYVPAPYREGLWHKWGTYRIGDSIFVEHIAVDRSWLVKYGDYALQDEAVVIDEHDAVMTNRFAPALRPVFEASGIEFGRADHATVDGRLIVYEINTNPNLGEYVPAQDPRSLEKQRHARACAAAALFAIDCPESGTIELDVEDGLIRRTRANPPNVAFWRP